MCISRQESTIYCLYLLLFVVCFYVIVCIVQFMCQWGTQNIHACHLTPLVLVGKGTVRSTTCNPILTTLVFVCDNACMCIDVFIYWCFYVFLCMYSLYVCIFLCIDVDCRVCYAFLKFQSNNYMTSSPHSISSHRPSTTYPCLTPPPPPIPSSPRPPPSSSLHV